MKIDEVTALVTGGASGIGLAVGELLLRGGARVLLTDVNRERGEAERERLQRRFGSASTSTTNGTVVVAFFQQDVLEFDSFPRAFDYAEKTFGGRKVNVLFNNAGIPGDKNQLFVDPTSNNWKATIDVNLTSVVRGIQVAVDRMGRAAGGSGGDGGVIINTASAAGLAPATINPVYCASKFGVVGLTQSLKHLRATKGIRVNAVCPAFTDTPMVQYGLQIQKDALFAKMVKNMGGLIEVSVVANAVLDLIRDESRNVDIVLITKKRGVEYIRNQVPSKL